ncbi:hypothetical protein C7D73_30655, partial [Klebsiella pneumoniae]
AKRVGEVKLFLWSTTAFAIASWACGVSNSLTYADFLPRHSGMAKRVGEVKLFLWSTTAFAIASWACGVSNSLTY